MADTQGMAATHTTDPVAEAREVLRRCIAGLMGASHVTQTELAAVLGMDQGSLSKKLRSKNGPAFNEDQLAKIAAYFKVDVPDLYRPDRVLVPRTWEGKYAKPGSLGTAGQATKPGLVTTAKAA